MSERPYLLELAESLWPPGSAPKGQSFVIVPTRGRPSFLLPPDRAAAATALRAYGGHGSRLSRLRSRMAGGVMASGLGSLLFRDRVCFGGGSDSISAELERVLGEPVRVALRAGPPRANRKPVLAVMDADARLLAFAKVGSTPLAERLVRAEGATLQRLAALDMGMVRPPRAIHCGTWQDKVLLVQEALPIRSARSLRADALLRTVQSVAWALGTPTALRWAASDHAGLVRERLEQIPAGRPASALAAAVDVLAAQRLALPLGSWHGDLTPWNCAAVDGSVVVWDWERFGTGVPLGFDLLHFHLQSALARAGVPTRRQPDALVAGAASRLAPLELTRDQTRLVVVAYLVEVASRYLADDQAAAGAGVGEVERWLLPVIGDAVSGLRQPA
jgi:hypothetical protein